MALVFTNARMRHGTALPYESVVPYWPQHCSNVHPTVNMSTCRPRIAISGLQDPDFGVQSDQVGVQTGSSSTHDTSQRWSDSGFLLSDPILF